MPIYPGRRPKTYRVTVFSRGKQYEEIVEGTKDDARAHEAKMRADLKAQRVTRSRAVPRFFDFCESQYVPHAKRHLGSRTWKLVRIYQIATLTEFFGRMKLDAIQTQDVERFKAERLAATWRGKPIKRSSINTDLRTLRAILRWAEEIGALAKAPRVKLYPPHGTPRVHFWTAAEVGKLYATAQQVAPELVAMLHFLLETGCRKGEALAAEWSWVQYEAKELRIPVTEYWRPKDREAREVPLSDALLRMLRARPHEHDEAIFPNRLGARYLTFPEKAFRALVKRAGLRGGPHTTRHTFASHFLAAVPDLGLLGAVMGHSETTMTERYAHMLPDRLKRARNAVRLPPSLANDSGDARARRGGPKKTP